MTRSVLIAAVAALLGGATVAGASSGVPHIFGHGGKVYVVDAACHRVSFPPPGISDHKAINVLGQQVSCLVHRPDPFARCVRHLGPPPTVQLIRRDDWTNVDKLQAYVAAVAACSTSTY